MVAEVLNFQGMNPILGMGSLSKLTFKAKDVGNFVVLNKVKGKTRVKSEVNEKAKEKSGEKEKKKKD